ncbi:hypothetical protein [Gordonia sputi]|uniref:hypothetical protein n=1 Tax=Gordonia sputi TaxID=36823 RepID=UPI002043D855|nr:hypothetical protein [Gordonia sputi]MCM3898043.1 hypothetical protein [Gordonia sputi]
MADKAHLMNEGLVHTVAQNWTTVAGALERVHSEFLVNVSNIHGWVGVGKDAAQEALVSYAGAVADLQARAAYMAAVVQCAADTLNLTKNALPPSSEVDQKLNDAEPSAAERHDAEEKLRQYAVTQMTSIYDRGVQEVAKAAPLFGNPLRSESSDPSSSVPGLTGGPGSASTGPGTSAPSGVGPVAAPDVSALTKAASRTPPTVPSATQGGVPAGLSSGLSGLSGLGQSAVGQAQSAAQQLASLAKNPLAPVKGLHALDAAKKALGGAAIGALGRAGGGGGAGKGGGGAGGVGKLGASGVKSLSDAEKAVLARGVKSLGEAERAALSTSRGASASSGGGPMGGGGAGGARGAGGEDKEHKANKFLRTTVNGEVLVGAPPVVTAAVIREA